MDKIDVFIPVHSKDFPTLPHCVRSLRKFLRPAPGRIMVISAPIQPVLRDQFMQSGVTDFVDESAVPGLPPLSQFPSIFIEGRQDRIGWYYQQFIKWQIADISTTPSYMVFDADTILINPLVVMKDSQAILLRNEQYHAPYFDTFERLLGFRPPRGGSFIADYMVFKAAYVSELKETITARNGGKFWVDAVLAALEKKNNAEFSEFETYGCFMERFHPAEIASAPDRHLGFPRSEVAGHWGYRLYGRLTGKTSISYHEYDCSAKSGDAIQHAITAARPTLGQSICALWSLGKAIFARRVFGR